MSQSIITIFGLFEGAAIFTQTTEHAMGEKMVSNITAWAGIPEGETVIAVTPTDMMLGGKKGMAIGAKGIYWKNGIIHPEMSLTWEQLAQTTDSLIANPKKKILELVGGKVFDMTNPLVTNTALKDLLTRLAQHWEESPEQFTSEVVEFGIPVAHLDSAEEVQQDIPAPASPTPPSTESKANTEITKKHLVHIATFMVALFFSPIMDSFLMSVFIFYMAWAAIGLARPDLGFSDNKDTHIKTLVGCTLAIPFWVYTLGSYDDYLEANTSTASPTPQVQLPVKAEKPMPVQKFNTVASLYEEINYNFSTENGTLAIHQDNGTSVSLTVKWVNSVGTPAEYLREDVQRALLTAVYTIYMHTDVQVVLVTSGLLDMNSQSGMHPELSESVGVSRSTALSAIRELGIATSFDQLLESECQGAVCHRRPSDKFDRILYNDYKPGRTKVFNYLKARSSYQHGA